MIGPSSFVADGYRRTRQAAESAAWAEVEAEYADRLAAGNSVWARLRVACQIAREARRRLDRRTPPHALY